VNRRFLWKDFLPHRAALVDSRMRKVHHEAQAAHEGGVERALTVRGQDRQTAVCFMRCSK